MEGGAIGHNFDLVQGFQRRRFKCERLRCTTDGRQAMAKAHMNLWPGGLKTILKEC
jgi:hypothetical protein